MYQFGQDEKNMFTRSSRPEYNPNEFKMPTKPKQNNQTYTIFDDKQYNRGTTQIQPDFEVNNQIQTPIYTQQVPQQRPSKNLKNTPSKYMEPKEKDPFLRKETKSNFLRKNQNNNCLTNTNRSNSKTDIKPTNNQQTQQLFVESSNKQISSKIDSKLNSSRQKSNYQPNNTIEQNKKTPVQRPSSTTQQRPSSQRPTPDQVKKEQNLEKIKKQKELKEYYNQLSKNNKPNQDKLNSSLTKKHPERPPFDNNQTKPVNDLNSSRSNLNSTTDRRQNSMNKSIEKKQPSNYYTNKPSRPSPQKQKPANTSIENKKNKAYNPLNTSIEKKKSSTLNTSMEKKKSKAYNPLNTSIEKKKSNAYNPLNTSGEKKQSRQVQKQAPVYTDFYSTSQPIQSEVKKGNIPPKMPQKRNSQTNVPQKTYQPTYQPTYEPMEDDRPAFVQYSMGFQEEIPDQQITFKCDQGCGRSFTQVIELFQEALQRHRNICKKVFQNKRKAFDTQNQRIVDNDQKEIIKKSERMENKQTKQQKNTEYESSKIQKWKAQSQAFRSIIKQNRGQELSHQVFQQCQEKAQVETFSKLDLIPCQYCGRKFNEAAHDRHEIFCFSQQKRNVIKKPVKRR